MPVTQSPQRPRFEQLRLRLLHSLTTRILAIGSCLLSISAFEKALCANDNDVPNIVLILADDLGYGDVGCYNPDSKIPTPYINLLAREGMRFTDAYAGAAVCVPSRYALLTGRYAFRGAPLRWRSQPTIREGCTTLATLLADGGYAAACIGKWHGGFAGGVTRQDQPLLGGPLDRGFDHFFGQHGSLDQPPYFYIRGRRAVEPATMPIAESHDNSHSVIYQGRFWRAGKVAPNFKHEEVLDRYAQEAVSYLANHHRRAPEQPLLLYFALTAPHGPWLPAEQFAGKSAAGPLGDFVVHVDHVVGRVLNTLKALNLQDNTLVVFSSDNGPLWFEGDVQRYGHDSSGGLRGRKGDIWEGGVRVPLIARWPGTIRRQSTSNQVVSLIDLVATFAAIVGKDLPDGAGADSYNLLPVLLGQQGEKPVRDSLILQSTGAGNLAIRAGQWKYIPWRGSGGFLTKPGRIEPAPGEPAGQLYNLKDDPGEQDNRYQQRPEIVDRLSKLLEQQQHKPATARQ